MELSTPKSRITGKERDAETGMDDFGARFYSSSLGRFVSTDWAAVPTPTPYATLTLPQTLNLYAYVVNNPTTVVDEDGHDGDFGFEASLFELQHLIDTKTGTPIYGSVQVGGSASPTITPLPASLETKSIQQQPDDGQGFGGTWEVTYQVRDQGGNSMKNDKMVPLEDITNPVFKSKDPKYDLKQEGKVVTDSPILGRNSDGSPKTTNPDGTFKDVPLGIKLPIRFEHTFTQTIKISYGGKTYKVRENHVTITGTKKHHPTIEIKPQQP